MVDGETLNRAADATCWEETGAPVRIYLSATISRMDCCRSVSTMVHRPSHRLVLAGQAQDRGQDAILEIQAVRAERECSIGPSHGAAAGPPHVASVDNEVEGRPIQYRRYLV